MVVYGIDLGTCYSCIVRNDCAGSVIPVELIGANGKKFIPSVVTFDKRSGQPKVGATGKACLLTKPECTKAFVKRDMGKDFCDAEVFVKDGVHRKMSPIEISACILKHLFNGANQVEVGAGRQPATQAVITIPAKFDEKQRAQTKLAAEMAGIEVLGLLQEPTAAALAYDIPAGSTVLVFDLGGGTLDVSIVTHEKGNYKVIGTPAGNGQLGGMDWDEKLVELAFQKVGQRPNKSEPKEWNRLMGRAENVKQALTENDEIYDEDVEGGNLIESEEVCIERSEFETVCQGLLNKCWEIVDKAIENAKAQNPKLKIDFFLTVGGSSRMPMIRKGLAARYGAIYGKGKSESEWLRIKDPDTAIAIGAAKYAQMLVANERSANKAEKNLKGIEDRATHSYGIKIKKDGEIVIKNLVKSSDPIIFQQDVEGLRLSADGESFSMEVYENDSYNPYAQLDASVRMIRRQTFSFGVMKPKGTPVKLSINRDKDGLIKLTLECDKFRQTFDANPSEQLIDEETRANIQRSLSLMEQA